jgi:ferredoxin
MRACPYKLIHPDLGESGLDGLFTPTLHLRSRNRDPEAEEYCFQDCVACTQVCPTGALRPLTVEEKHAQPIGLAVIDHQKCIAWAKHEYCAVCDEYCPYQAIKLVDQKGVNCPIVDADKCRGCGACEGGCAASPIAIVVRPLAPSPCGK